MKVKAEELLEVYDDISKHIQSKRKIYMFEKNKMQNLLLVKRWLEEGYHGGIYHIFLIKDPKYRIIMSLNMNDKIINHYVAQKILLPKLEKYLDKRNIATRKGLGTDYGIRLIKKYLEEHKKYDKFYILKMDISKYFYSIDHKVLKNLLVDKLDEEEMNIINKIIDSTNKEYINTSIDKIIEMEKKSANLNKIDELNNIPRYCSGKGLPIGNLTSQLLSIFYLYKLDHYIIHDLHLKHYVRYMDDFVMIHHDKAYLNKCKKNIEELLWSEFKLKTNNKKTEIKSNREGFDCLGYRFRVINKKTIINLRGRTLRNMKHNLKATKNNYQIGKISLNSYFGSVNNYLYGFKYGSYSKRKRMIDRCIKDIGL